MVVQDRPPDTEPTGDLAHCHLPAIAHRQPGGPLPSSQLQRPAARNGPRDHAEVAPSSDPFNNPGHHHPPAHTTGFPTAPRGIGGDFWSRRWSCSVVPQFPDGSARGALGCCCLWRLARRATRSGASPAFVRPLVRVEAGGSRGCLLSGSGSLERCEDGPRDCPCFVRAEASDGPVMRGSACWPEPLSRVSRATASVRKQLSAGVSWAPA